MKTYDAIIIGSGQAGTPLSKKLAEAGLRTALIEKRWVGGTCVNDGCSPTKTMIASAKAAWNVANSFKLGVTAENRRIDLSVILKRKNEVVEMMRISSEEGILKTENLDLIYGTACFTGLKEIEVMAGDGSKQLISADKIFINTGEMPVIPEIPGIHEIEFLTSTTLLDLKIVPEHLVIVGGGYIGLEFGQMYRRFGSKITILEPSERLLSREDEDIASEVHRILSEEDIDIILNSTVTAFHNEGSEILITLDLAGEGKRLICSHVLIAAGRKPQTEKLNLSMTGVKVDQKGYVEVDEFLETSTKGIFALGDVKGGPAFTHIAYDDYRIIRKNLLENGNESTANRIVPYCMFIDPQLGRVGISEEEAKKQGIDYVVASLKNDSVARSIETGDKRGMMKAVVDASSGKILGAAVLAEQGGEVVTIFQMAMIGNVSYRQLKDGVFAHPTYAESLNNLFMTLDK